MVNEPAPDRVEERSRELFEDSVDRLDARTRSRLNQARQLALNELKTKPSRRYWVGAPLGGLTAALLITIFVFSGRETVVPSQDPGGLPLDDFDIVADADNLELLQDVEFYTWLADAGSDSNSG